MKPTPKVLSPLTDPEQSEGSERGGPPNRGTNPTGNLPKELDMGAARTSNKDVLDAIQLQTDSIDKLIGVLTATASQAAVTTAPAAVEATAISGNVEVDAKYLAHMNIKAAEHATNKGEPTVLYARKNKAGETKLAYALRSRYDEVVAKQPSCLGPIGTFQP